MGGKGSPGPYVSSERMALDPASRIAIALMGNGRPHACPSSTAVPS